MLSIPKSKSEFFFSVSGAALLLSIAVGASAWFELRELRLALADQKVPTQVSGRLQVKPKQILLHGNGGLALDCAPAFCGYPDALDDDGRVVTVGMTGGRIVEVIVDGQRRDFRDYLISSKKSSIFNAALGFVFAMTFGLVGFLTRSKGRTPGS